MEEEGGQHRLLHDGLQALLVRTHPALARMPHPHSGADSLPLLEFTLAPTLPLSTRYTFEPAPPFRLLGVSSPFTLPSQLDSPPSIQFATGAPACKGGA